MNSTRSGDPTDERGSLPAVVALIREFKVALRDSDYQRAQAIASAAHSAVDQADGITRSHPDFEEVVVTVGKMDLAIEQMVWLLYAKRVLPETVHSARALVESTKAAASVEAKRRAWEGTAERFSTCVDTILDLARRKGATHDVPIVTEFGSLPLGDILSRCERGHDIARSALRGIEVAGSLDPVMRNVESALRKLRENPDRRATRKHKRVAIKALRQCTAKAPKRHHNSDTDLSVSLATPFGEVALGDLRRECQGHLALLTGKATRRSAKRRTRR